MYLSKQKKKKGRGGRNLKRENLNNDAAKYYNNGAVPLGERGMFGGKRMERKKKGGPEKDNFRDGQLAVVLGKNTLRTSLANSGGKEKEEGGGKS